MDFHRVEELRLGVESRIGAGTSRSRGYARRRDETTWSGESGLDLVIVNGVPIEIEDSRERTQISIIYVGGSLNVEGTSFLPESATPIRRRLFGELRVQGPTTRLF